MRVRRLLTVAEQAAYNESGFLPQLDVLGGDVLKVLRKDISDSVQENPESGVFEKSGEILRAAHGVHERESFLRELCCTDTFLGSAQQILGEKLYIHQSKVNFKAAFDGSFWPWHQDTIYWRNGDGISSSSLINAAICLDDMTPENGPLLFLKGSHKFGNLCNSENMGDWEKDVSDELPYQVPRKEVRSLSETLELVAAIGRKGSVFWFHPDIVHASTSNISAFDRALLILTFNTCDNAPTENKRPWFLSSRNISPLERND